MNALKYFLALLIVLLTGCTPLIVREPIGKNFSPEDLKAFEGVWKLEQTDEDPFLIQLVALDTEGRFRCASVEWDSSKESFLMSTMEVVLKRGEKYDVMHLSKDDSGDIPEGLFYITLFKIREDAKVMYWATKPNETTAFLESGVLETVTLEEKLVITDEAPRIIEALESSFEEIFDVEDPTVATKVL